VTDHVSIRSIKRTLKRWAYACGYVIESKRGLPTLALALAERLRVLALAERLREIFAVYAIDTVIDVGANEGQFAEFLRTDVGFTGEIESFEPIPALVKILMAKATDDKHWTVHHCALGAKPGKLTFNVMKSSVFSSFLKPIVLADERYDKWNTLSDTINVTVSTLDVEFFNKTDLRHTYLKLDTQGFDLEVLKGGKKSIMAIPAVQTEVSFRPLYYKMPGYKESIAAFGRHGFVIADFFLVARDNKHAALEFDALMIRPIIV
jgi:FkbM family methyltransferase